MTSPGPEHLLRCETRAQLPLRRQLLLYLDPFAFFADASRGSAAARARALAYNCEMRGILIAYLRRWVMIAAVLFLATQGATFVIPSAALAAGFCLAFTVACLTAAVYILLGSYGSENHRRP